MIILNNNTEAQEISFYVEGDAPAIIKTEEE